jgi:hypothetical protein
LNETIIEHFKELNSIEKSLNPNDILVEIIFANMCQKLENFFYEKLLSQDSPNLIVNIFSPLKRKRKFYYHDAIENYLNEFLQKNFLKTKTVYQFKIEYIIKDSKIHKHFKKILTKSTNLYFRPALVYIIYIWMTILNEEVFFRSNFDFDDSKKSKICNQIFKAYINYDSEHDNDVNSLFKLYFIYAIFI